MKACDANESSLLEAMSACDGLFVDSGVPAGREEVDM